MPAIDVILFSVIFSLGAGMVFVLIASFNRRPIRAFLITSTIVLILSFALPLKAPSPPVTLTAKLTLMTIPWVEQMRYRNMHKSQQFPLNWLSILSLREFLKNIRTVAESLLSPVPI